MCDKTNLDVSVYRRRQPEKSVLHRVIRENWLTFKDTTEQSGRALPVYVQKEDGYLQRFDPTKLRATATR